MVAAASKMGFKLALLAALGVCVWAFWPAESADVPDGADLFAADGQPLGVDGVAAESGAAQGSGQKSSSATQSDSTVVALWVLAALMAVFLVAFVIHTSPRRASNGVKSRTR